MKSIQFIADNQNVVKSILLLVLAASALKNDIKSYKIPNKLNAMFVVLGLGLWLIIGNVKASAIGLIFPMILFPLFAFRMIGAGDIKLFCAIGAIVGFPHIISVMAYSIIFNGLIAVVLMFYRESYSGFKKMFFWFKHSILFGTFMEYQSLDKNNKSIFRYAYGITLGCVYYIVTDLILGGCYALL